MQQDDEGFKYPHADANICIECGLCERVCPYLNSYPKPDEKPASYACRTKDGNLLEKSSSGGLFTMLATKTIRDGGVVFGAKFDVHWNVVHGFAETEEDLAAFRGSKYVQSDLGASFTQVKAFLKDGRKVMFTGTPCQVAGLNHFLMKKYDNLLTIDFVCHCVPSPLVWKRYLEELKGNVRITNVSFRDKSEGWGRYGLIVIGMTESPLDDEICSDGQGETVVLAKGSHLDNLYMKAFLSNLLVRPGCTNCPARFYTSGADITIADCWGFNDFHPDLNDDRGMSLALLLTDKGAALYHEIEKSIDSLKIPYIEVQEETNHNPIIRSPQYHPFRNSFFKAFIKGDKSATFLMKKYLDRRERQVKRMTAIKLFIRHIFGDVIINKLRGR